MATAIRRRRGTTDQHQAFIGLLGEITVDTDKDTIVIHDSVTTGGFPIAREDLSNVSSASITGAIDLNGLGRTKLALGTPDNVIINSPTGELSSEPQLAIARGGTGADNMVDARNNLGLGTMATQNGSFVNITGGTIVGITPLAVADGGTGASTAADARTNLGAVNIAGDTMTGNLTVGVGVGSVEIGIDGDSEDNRILSYLSNGIKRWEVRVNAEPETGGNVGSDFRISRFDDLGNFLDAPFNIDRETGKITLGGVVEFSSSLTLSSPLSISQGGTGASNTVDARANLGLGTISTQDSNNVSITGGSITGITPLAVVDGGTGSDNPAGARTNLGAVNIAGDTMTGDLTVGNSVGASTVEITGEDGFRRELQFSTLSLARWEIGTDSTLETGSNLGSDFVITRNDDAGSAIDTPFKITRNTGNISMAANVDITGSTTFNGSVSLLNPLPIASGGTGASSASGARLNLDLVSKLGDTFFGDVTIGDGVGAETLSVDGSHGNFRSLRYASTGFTRWTVVADDTAEGAPTGVQLTKVADPITLPTGTGFSVDFSGVVSHLAVAHSSTPHVTIYEESGGVFTKLSDPDVLPPGTGLGVAFSPDAVHLAVTHLTSPALTIYKRSGNTYTKLPDPSFLPPDIAWKPAFSPDGKFLAIAHTTSPFITIYERIGDNFTKLPDPATLPAGGANNVAFSPDTVHMAVAHAIAPWVTIYKISGTTFTKLPDPVNTPTGEGEGVSFSPNGTHLAIAHTNTPFITIYERSGDTFTKVADPATLPTDDAQSTQFSSDGSLLAVSHVGSPFATYYIRDNNVFTKIADPLTLPTGTGNGVEFSSNSAFTAVAHVNSPFVTIYDVSEITPDIGSDFKIRRHDDAGALLDSPIVIERSSGNVTVNSNTTFVQDVTINGTAGINVLTLTAPLAITSGGTGASTAPVARTNLGLGSIATQDSNNVSITGGSITGITPLAVADGGTGADNGNDAITNLGGVHLAGDTMTGDLVVGGGVGSGALTVDGQSGFIRAVNFSSVGSFRWNIVASADAETGSNVGSNFLINRNDDTGSFINTPVSINRSNGNIVLDANVTVTGSLGVTGSFSLTIPLGVSSGGTGANNSNDAITNLGGVHLAGDTMTGDLQVPGFRFTQGLRVSRRPTPTNYTTTAQDFIIGVTDLTVSRVITLVSASTIGAGGTQIIKDETGLSGGMNNITIQAAGAELIDGQPSIVITANYGVVRLYSDGLNWYSI